MLADQIRTELFRFCDGAVTANPIFAGRIIDRDETLPSFGQLELPG